MIKSTWPEKRPLLTDIINVLYEQNTEDTTIDKTESTIAETKLIAAIYLDLSK